MYLDAKEFCSYLRTAYPNLKFQILYIDSIKRPSNETIINVFIEIPTEYLVKHHFAVFHSPTNLHVAWYRQVVTDIIKQEIMPLSNVL